MIKTLLTLTALALPTATLAQQGNPGGHFVENWDLDSNSQVSLAEAEERRNDIFTTFDMNEDGQLDAEEYKAFDEARAADMQGQGDHGQNGLKGVNAGMMRSFNDTDGNGTVSREEFTSHTAAWFERMDRNGDGVVTTADFGRKG